MSTNCISTSSSTCSYLICHGQGIKAARTTKFSFPATTNRNQTIGRTQSLRKLGFKYGSISSFRSKSRILVPVNASSSPNGPFPSSWQTWMVGILMTMFLGYKGGLLSKLKCKIDQAVQVVGNLARVVEEVGEEAEKIVEEVEEKLPGDSKLRQTLESFDNLAKHAVNDAKKAEEVVHKVKDVEEEIEETIKKGEKAQPKKKL
ncbi:uncharacterized protein LOC127248822 [Andrographis paniculata]|uniref:uncharacterized protein LOC127248822 n=1 Tax=Andrographis paniculata TaxID=175694 RepID=UPI0021E846EE|nr:uncharacterized protein LOC127248822 [Andrographis paniculata]